MDAKVIRTRRTTERALDVRDHIYTLKDLLAIPLTLPFSRAGVYSNGDSEEGMPLHDRLTWEGRKCFIFSALSQWNREGILERVSVGPVLYGSDTKYTIEKEEGSIETVRIKRLIIATGCARPAARLLKR